MGLTVIIDQPKPSENFAILRLKKQVRKGDTVIFEQGDKQQAVELTYASEPDSTDGIMKKYQLIGWAVKLKIERIDNTKAFTPENVQIIEDGKESK